MIDVVVKSIKKKLVKDNPFSFYSIVNKISSIFYYLYIKKKYINKLNHI